MKSIDYEDVIKRIKAVYSSCSKQEQALLFSILSEISDKGYSYTLEQIWLADFKEVPLSIDQFIASPDYLGEATNGGKSVYPFWSNMMSEVFNNGNRYNEIVLSGATRIGKTSTAVTILAYMLYRLMIYRDPHGYFSKKPTSRFTLAFANLTKDLATGVAFYEFNSTIKESKWFLDRGTMNKSTNNPIYLPAGDKINIVPCSDAAHALGMQLWGALMDETNFSKAGVKDIVIAKRHMKNLYDTINARISGTFRIGGEVYGKLIASSSKNTDSDFLSEHIEKQIAAGNEHMYLVDKPQWEILPKSMFSTEVFHFTVGDRYKKGFVIPAENDDEEHREEYRRQGYTVVEAPAELRRNFLADYDISLRDIAGISVAGSMGFITQESITPCIAEDRVNPFYEDILVIGSKDKDVEIHDFFHADAVPAYLKSQKMNIHIDLAETKNRTGVSGACVAGNKIIENEEGKRVSMPFIKQVFSVGIEAPRGDRQSFQKIVNFIIWLRQKGFNIGIVSTDQFQSDFLRETLSAQNFETIKVSISKSMEPFIGMKNLLIDQRVELVKNQQQEDEFVSIERVGSSVVLPEAADGGHCDIAEACVGSCWTLVTSGQGPSIPMKSAVAVASQVNGGAGVSSRGTNPNQQGQQHKPSSGLGIMFNSTNKLVF